MDAKREPHAGPVARVMAYHERTKHFPHRYARSLGYLDWDTQPNPFRRYEGSPVTALPIPTLDRSPKYDDLFGGSSRSPSALTLETLSEFFYYSLAISAWKSIPGSTWSLRVNPSSGNLHPTEAYAWIGPVAGLSAPWGLYHYVPEVHSMELRWEGNSGEEIPSTLRGGGFIVGLSSIHWRESWKYGERAYRYCQHDMGHAIAALQVAAAIQGWNMHLLESVDDGTIARILGLDRAGEFHPAELEEPALLAVICASSPAPRDEASRLFRLVAAGRWHGRANPLSADHHPWTAIDEVRSACARNDTIGIREGPLPLRRSLVFPSREPLAGEVVRRRRSAVSMDGSTRLTSDEFFRILHRVMPGENFPLWDLLPWPPSVDLVLFAHRVDGLVSGLYCLVRDPRRWESLKQSMSQDFRWARPAGVPEELPLYLLEEGDVRSEAAGVSCGQDIAADGVFAVAMLAEFEDTLRAHGAWFYRRLHWEAGAIGQMLYLEAEAAGVQATGIGCFFDDSFHELIGLESHRFQTIYHFTVGGAVEDPRLTTLPAYPRPGLAEESR